MTHGKELFDSKGSIEPEILSEGSCFLKDAGMILEGLAIIKVDTSPTEARKLFKQSVVIFRRIGDRKRAKRIEEHLRITE